MRNHSFAPSEFYHIYSRGIEKRPIFKDVSDYDRFVSLMFFCNGTKPIVIRDIPKGLSFVDGANRRGQPIVEIGAYCLMPNHFHLLVREPTGEGISKFMLKLLTGYSYYFNTKNKRKGRLFESSFQSKHVDSDEYLKYLFAYIHLNPLKFYIPNWREGGVTDEFKALAYLSSYPYSSFSEYVGKNRDERHILTSVNFPKYFKDSKEFIDLFNDWIKFSSENIFNDPTEDNPL